MKTSSIIFGLASAATLALASPAAQLLSPRQDDPGNCRLASNPAGCVKDDSSGGLDPSACVEYCFPNQDGCNCCMVKDGEVDYDDCLN